MGIIRPAVLLLCLLAGNAASIEIICSECPKNILRAVEQSTKAVPDTLVVDSALAVLHDMAYLDAEGVADNSKLVLFPGTQFRLKSVKIHKDPLSAVGIDKPFTEANLDRAVDQLLEKYRGLG